jgi:nitrogenase iron protein NifH
MACPAPGGADDAGVAEPAQRQAGGQSACLERAHDAERAPVGTGEEQALHRGAHAEAAVKQRRVFEELDVDVVIYDVLGDVVCGGFSVPIREGIAERVFTVSSSDFMAIYATNNLYKGIRKYSQSRGALFGGIIANSINSPMARQLIDDFADKTKTRVLEHVPRSVTVTHAELSGKTTLEAAPDSAQASIYRSLAEKIISTEYQGSTPCPLDVGGIALLEDITAKYGTPP